MSGSIPAPSREWEIAERLRVLIRSASNGTLTDAERGELNDLQRERVKRMKPKFTSGQSENSK